MRRQAVPQMVVDSLWESLVVSCALGNMNGRMMEHMRARILINI
eukprot:SAG31_NODE_3897_length_3772_cov_2.529540_4_plen_44_part_00